MLLRLFLLFTLVPLAELYLLIEVGSYLGALPTIAIVIGTGFAGAYLARLQGFATLARIRENTRQGIVPTDDLLDGVLILVAGVVLLTPGLITDCMGLLLLIPVTRNLLKEKAKRAFERAAQRGTITIQRF